jgi:hypothetical protein
MAIKARPVNKQQSERRLMATDRTTGVGLRPTDPPRRIERDERDEQDGREKQDNTTPLAFLVFHARLAV